MEEQLKKIDELIDKLNNAEAKAILIDYKNKQMTEEISEKIKKKAERKEDLLFGAIPTVAEAKKIGNLKLLTMER